VLAGKRRWPRYTGPSTKVRQQVRARSGGWCEIRSEGCGGRAVELSHRLAVKAGGRHGTARARVNGTACVLHSCGPCHRQITSAHGPALADARARGLLLTEDQDPQTVPVVSPAWSEPVWLDNNGGWTNYTQKESPTQ
jgi:5-methylcytosine-specific restriction enzyme A